VIEFYLDQKSGVTPYLQLVQQVRRSIKLGLLQDGDQLPTVKDVVGKIAINPNTVSKAYRELEHQGLVVARTGVGTFVNVAPSEGPPATLRPLQRDLRRWISRARDTGLDDESIEALFIQSFRDADSVVAP
jgi:DNA-binding transcriptional regulator YhcF (GntR family)